MYKKLKEKAHPYALDDVNQETRTHASSTSIQHSIQNVEQGSKKILSDPGLYLLACAALHDEEQEDHLSNCITLSSNAPGSSKLSPALE